MVPVAGALPELAAQDGRRADLLVPGLRVLVAPVVDHGVPEAHALGVEEGEAGPLLVEAEQIEVAADAAVVALAGHLEGLEVRRQLLLLGEGGAVDAGELGVVLVAAPVGAGQAGELEGALADAAGAGRCGPRQRSTNSPWVYTLMVGTGSPTAAAAAARSSTSSTLKGWFKPVGQALGRLTDVGRAEDEQRLVERQLETGDRQVLGHDLGHLLFDARELGIGDGLDELEVVVEAVLDGRPDGVLGRRPEAQDRLRQQVRAVVAQDVEAVGRVEGDDGDLIALLERVGQVDEAAGAVGFGAGAGLGIGAWRDRRAPRRLERRAPRLRRPPPPSPVAARSPGRH